MNTQWLKIEFQVLCLFFLAVLAVYHLRLEQQKNILKSIYGIMAVIIGTDVVNCLLCGQKGVLLSCLAMETIHICCFAIVGFLWLCYYIAQNPKEAYESCGFKVLSFLPAIGMVLLSLVSLKTGWIYRINEDMQLVRGEQFYLVLLPLIYVLWVAVLALSDRKIAKTEQERNNGLVPVVLAVILILAGTLEVFVLRDGLPVMTGFILLSMFLLFARGQDRKIRVDKLTQLLNRYGMEDELNEQLEEYQKDHNDSFYVIMCDLDNFKYINDTWGHMEGDRALVLISETLARVAEQYGVMAFRMGGDEFVVIADTSDEAFVEQVCQTLKQELNSIDFRDDFTICMSVGAKKYDGKESVEELLNKADKLLYEAKRESKKEQK